MKNTKDIAVIVFLDFNGEHCERYINFNNITIVGSACLYTLSLVCCSSFHLTMHWSSCVMFLLRRCTNEMMKLTWPCSLFVRCCALTPAMSRYAIWLISGCPTSCLFVSPVSTLYSRFVYRFSPWSLWAILSILWVVRIIVQFEDAFTLYSTCIPRSCCSCAVETIAGDTWSTAVPDVDWIFCLFRRSFSCRPPLRLRSSLTTLRQRSRAFFRMHQFSLWRVECILSRSITWMTTRGWWRVWVGVFRFLHGRSLFADDFLVDHWSSAIVCFFFAGS